MQLRESNHARSPWKFARGRGRVPLGVPPEHVEHACSTTTSQSPVRAAEVAYTQSRPNSQDPISGLHGAGISNGPVGFNPYAFAGMTHHLPSPDTPSVSKDRAPAYYPVRANSTSTTTTSVSPSPSTLGQPQAHMPSAVPHYPFPMNMGYYPSQWMQPYTPYTYAYSFMPGPQTPYSSMPDGSGYPSALHSGQWVAMSDAHKVSICRHSTIMPTNDNVSVESAYGCKPWTIPSTCIPSACHPTSLAPYWIHARRARNVDTSVSA